ncbi:hypothetical protein [Mesorhizobium sp. WSM4312]|uniref:hypothetical protein n=1 Tax=Mesorhizobium sp. WSM4312 TaxID=2029411 RepID=UPI001FE15016|nr:hypothetical protein [Mesorhizobium sp. WSM4312]
MPWKNSIKGPLPLWRTFKVMRPMSTRREMKWSEAMSAAMSMILGILASLPVSRKRIIQTGVTSSRLSDNLHI